MIRLSLKRLVAAVAFALLASSLHAQDRYIDQVEVAIDFIEQGDYDSAAQSVNAALALDANESLANLCLAVIYTHVGQVEQAVMQYKVALGLREQDPLAFYGLGLALLGRPDIEGAVNQFRSIDSDSGAVEVRPVLAYLHSLTGEYGAASRQVSDLSDMVSKQLRATTLFKAGKLPEAKVELTKLVEQLPTRGYAEQPGTVVTFDPRQPVHYTGRPPDKLIVPPSIEAAKATKVSGSVRLRADLQRAPEVSFVLFFVNDRLVAIVNHPPFEHSWDSTRVVNGIHTVKIQGQTANNQVVNEKSMRVRVQNEGVERRVLTGERVDALRARLWERIRIGPSLAAAHYMLAKCAMDEGDANAAAAHLEKVMAANPTYFDTRTLLREAYGRLEPYRELREGPKDGGKTIALTFDDGPNAMTGRILDILKQENVKGTFFVVGEMCVDRLDVLTRMREEGHDIQNHTYSHRNLKHIPVTEIEKELFRTKAIIRDVTGERSIYFRPPGGHMDANTTSVARGFGLLPVFWTANCSRYEGTNVETMVRYIDSSATPGGILLMHNGEDITVAALTAVIKTLRDKGYRFVTVSEVFSRR